MKGLELKVQEIADRVRELRTIEGLSEEYMAQKIGVTVDEYRLYEAGNQELDFAFLYTCAQVLNVDVTELIEGITPRLSSYIMTRKGEGLRVEQAHGMTYYNLAYKFRDRVAEPLFVHSTFSADAQLKPIEVTVHEGHEFNFGDFRRPHFVWFFYCNVIGNDFRDLFFHFYCRPGFKLF